MFIAFPIFFLEIYNCLTYWNLKSKALSEEQIANFHFFSLNCFEKANNLNNFFFNLLETTVYMCRSYLSQEPTINISNTYEQTIIKISYFVPLIPANKR